MTGPDGEGRLDEGFKLPTLSIESYRTYSGVFGPLGENTITVSVGETNVSETATGERILSGLSVADEYNSERNGAGDAPSSCTVKMGGQGPTGIVCVLVDRVRGTWRAGFDVVPDPDAAADRFADGRFGGE